MSSGDKEESGSLGTSHSITPPLDIAHPKIEQETEDNVGLTRPNSQLAVSLNGKPETSLNFLLSSLSKSLPPSSLSAASLSLIRAQVDYQQHENEDATQYSDSETPINESPVEAFSRENGADGEVQVQEDKNSSKQNSNSNDYNLPLPQQAKEGEENPSEELVFTNYSSASLTSTYFIIHNSEQVKTQTSFVENSANVNETDTPLFTIDDDPPGNEDDKEGGSLSFNRLLLNFDDNHSTVKPNLSRSRETVSSSEMKDEVNVVKTPPVKLDQADQHREPTTGLEAALGNHTISTTGETVHAIKRSKVCSSIAKCPPDQTQFNIPKFNAGNNVKVECKLYPQGLDQDCKGRNLTLTGTFHLPKDTKKSAVFKKQCICKLSAYIYEGEIEDRKLIGQSTASHELSDDERQSLTVCMTVHEVASQVSVIFSKRCPEKLLVKIVTEIKFID